MSEEFIAQFVNSEIKTSGGGAEALDVSIGKRSSPAGTGSTSSMFGWVKSIFANIGSSSDAAGTSTSFARLRQIYEYLTTNLSSSRAVRIDNIDATISSRAPSSTALSTAQWTSTRAGYLDRLANGGMPIVKSRQSGTLYYSLTDASNFASQGITISSVAPAKCIVLLDGAISFQETSVSSAASIHGPYVSGLTATKLTISLEALNLSTTLKNRNALISWQVIELY